MICSMPACDSVFMIFESLTERKNDIGFDNSWCQFTYAQLAPFIIYDFGAEPCLYL